MRLLVRGLTSICLMFVLFPAFPSYGQLSLQSVSPADGTTNVDSNLTIELVFSAGLDTTFHFRDPSDFYLGIFSIPDSIGEPDTVEVSPDFRTVTISGFVLSPNSTVSIILVGAKGLGGESLDHPYVFTFTTGSSLPSGSVSGNVDYPGNNPSGALVALFENFFEEDPIAVGLSLSPYQVNYVPDGNYTAIAIKDFNQDGSLDFGRGDAFGVYDPNGDGIPDLVNVSGGGNTSGINLELAEPILRTAQSSYDIANPRAQGIYEDAVLGGIFSSGNVVPEDGTSYMWFHDFIVQSDTLLLTVMQFSDKAVAFVVDTLDTLFDVPLPMGWMDSDAAIDTAEANGGSEFRQMNEDAEVFANLFPEDFDEGPDGLSIGKGIAPRLDRHPSRNKKKSLKKTARGQAVEPFWFFDYYSEENDDGLFIVVNALTGEVVNFNPFSNTSAKMNVNQADFEAGMWANDAQLVSVGSLTGDLDANGFAIGWGYVYYSASKDSGRVFSFFGGFYDGSEPYPEQVPSQDPLPPEWLDSAQIMPTAESNSDQFRQNHFAFFVDGFLSRNNLPNIPPPTGPAWCIDYFDFFTFDSLRIYIDAITGQVINVTAVEDGEEISLPDQYALFQNYPNPFNPETLISYDLPKESQVRLVIYNPLGQVVRILVDKQQPAGNHAAAWDGLNDRGLAVPNGIYFYKLQTSEFTRSKKMTLLK